MSAPGPLPDPYAAELTDARRARLRERLREHGDDIVHIVTAAADVRYLTGFHGSNGTLAISADQAVLFTDFRYVERAAAIEGVTVSTGPRGLVEICTTVAADHRSIDIDGDGITGTQLLAVQRDPGLADVPVSITTSLTGEVRRVKDPAEIEVIEAACRIAESALERVLERIRPGMSEARIARELLIEMLQSGAEDAAFAAIVAAGPHGAIPHHEPTDRVVAAGELLTIDFGARLVGYHSDITRTFIVGAEPTPRQQEIHDLVCAAQRAGREAVAAGVAVAEVDRAARTLIEQAGLGPEFGHGTGHGVGLDIHESPLVSGTSPGTLEDRMTITVEPGVYLTGWGGVRIEDTVVVTRDGCRSLSRLQRGLQRLG